MTAGAPVIHVVMNSRNGSATVSVSYFVPGTQLCVNVDNAMVPSTSSVCYANNSKFDIVTAGDHLVLCQAYFIDSSDPVGSLARSEFVLAGA